MSALSSRLIEASIDGALLTFLAAAVTFALSRLHRSAAAWATLPLWTAVLAKPVLTLLGVRFLSVGGALASALTTTRASGPGGAEFEDLTQHGAIAAFIAAPPSWIGVVWLSAFLLVALRAAAGAAFARRAELRADARLRRLAAGTAGEIGLTRAVRVRVLKGLAGPAVAGAFRPCVLVPEWLVRSNEELLKWTLRHELTHVRCGHTVLVLLRDLCFAAFFFHPLLRWAVRRWTEAVERSCDRSVARRFGDASSYCRALFQLQRRSQGAAVGALPTYGLAVGGGALATRIAELLDEPTPPGERPLLGWGLCVLLLLPGSGAVVPAPAVHDHRDGAGPAVVRRSVRSGHDGVIVHERHGAESEVRYRDRGGVWRSASGAPLDAAEQRRLDALVARVTR